MDNVIRIKDPMDAKACLMWSVKKLSVLNHTVAGAATVVALAVPLYAIGYQEGSYPFVGWLLAWFLGSVAMGLVVNRVSGGTDAKGGWTRTMRAIGKMGVAYSVLGGLSVAVSLTVVSSLGGGWVPDSWLGFYDNSLVWWWKPMAHVGAMGVMFLAVVPFVVLSVVVQAGGRMSNGQARRWVRSYLHGTAYNPWKVMAWCYPVAAFAFVPVVGILAVPIAAWMAFRFYSYAYATK